MKKTPIQSVTFMSRCIQTSSGKNSKCDPGQIFNPPVGNGRKSGEVSSLIVGNDVHYTAVTPGGLHRLIAVHEVHQRELNHQQPQRPGLQ